MPNLALAQLKRRAAQTMCRGQPLGLQHDAAGRLIDPRMALAFRRSAQALDQPPAAVGVARVQRVPDLSFADDADAVAQRRERFDAVRDIQDGHAARAKTAQHAENGRKLLYGEHGVQLVHDQHTRIAARDLYQLHEPLLRQIQLLRGRMHVDAAAELAEALLRLRVDGLPVDMQKPAVPERPGADAQIFRHREIRQQRGLLENGLDAPALRVARMDARE